MAAILSNVRSWLIGLQHARAAAGVQPAQQAEWDNPVRMAYAGLRTFAPAIRALALLPLAALAVVPGLPPAAAAALGILHALLLFGLPTAVPSAARALGVLAAAAAAAVAGLAGGWLLVAWISFLIGLRMSQLLASAGKYARAALVAEVLLLLVLLFFGALAQAVTGSAGTGFAALPQVVLVLWACALALAALARREGEQPEAELLGVALFFLLTLVLSLSAAVAVADGVLAFGPAVLLAVAVGEAIVAVMWLAWSPLLGGGLSTVFFRHVLALGVPVDEWLALMEQIADRKASAADFWREALLLLQERMRLNGLRWRPGNGEGFELGSMSGHSVDLPLRDGSLRACSGRRWFPTAIFNLWMLARVSAEFRQAKVREETRAAEAAVRSVNEMDAKTTHDIKNLLHIIKLMAGRPAGGPDGRIEQLGKLAGRLEAALNSLGSADAGAAAGATIGADVWWQGMQERYRGIGVQFASASPEALKEQVPVEIFERAIENMVHNSMRKSAAGRTVRVVARLEQGPALEVADDGQAVPEGTVARLFAAPVPSADGMGIGLFQLAAAADKAGWRLRLAANDAGDVRFRLEPAPYGSGAD